MNMPPNLWSKPNAGLFYKTLNKVRILADRFIIKHSIDVITVAEELNMKRANEIYEKTAKIVYFGVDYDFFSKGNAEKAKKKFKLKNRFVVIQSGIICEARNQLESIKAIEKVRDKIPNILLILAGKEDLPYKQKIAQYTKTKKLEKNILFAGCLRKREELRDLYKASYVGLYPIGGQGGVLAPFEVLCAEKPIIVSEDMETAPMIKKHNFGIVTKDYSKALVEIYNNYTKYQKQAKTNSKWIKENLTWENFTELMIGAYKDALKMHKN